MMDALSMLLEDVHLYQTQFFYVHGQGKWAFYVEKKDCIVFYLVIKGEIMLSIASNKRIAKASDLMMVPGGMKHEVTSVNPPNYPPIDLAPLLIVDNPLPVQLGSSDGGETADAQMVVIVCHYDREITRPLLTALPSLLPENSNHQAQKQLVLDIGTRFLSLESSQNRLGKNTIINRLASILMIECVRTYIEDMPEGTGNWLKALKDPYLSKALAVMHDSPDFNWTIHKLAEVAGMSRSSFAEHFREVVGEPPLTYLTDYRLRLAARYLRLQENSISRISELVGYASDSTFSQAFKRVYGMSPRKYRQQFRQDEITDGIKNGDKSDTETLLDIEDGE